ncbi:N-acetylmuramoyl-L-alanine amidase [Sulfurimonas sp.]|uniref:N-acetylmuramoyl-L-alanine amidase n=1 Tax=Sulfurimonas sp. TaxID=2022749 RepID=UPI0025D6813A|nr:N-acetylmuramoyl-L-alanine amidase [Sulfurimonas sp.]
MKVAIVIGHSTYSRGARNKSSDVSEFEFNEKLAKDIKANWSEHNLSDEIVLVYRENGYSKLPYEINDLDVDLVISLHCNAFNTTASGCEMLYYHKSVKGKNIAKIFQDKLTDILENKDRGIKSKDSEDRGGHLLKATNAPCIIVEPFFIDNDDDFLNATDDGGALVEGYCDAIDEALKYLKS